MAKRKKLSRSSSKRSFTKNAKTHGKNMMRGVMRGGIRL